MKFSSHLRLAVLGVVLVGVGVGVGYLLGWANTRRHFAPKLTEAQQELAQSARYPLRENKNTCVVLTCSNGKTFPTCACTDTVCTPVAYFADPCANN